MTSWGSACMVTENHFFPIICATFLSLLMFLGLFLLVCGNNHRSSIEMMAKMKEKEREKNNTAKLYYTRLKGKYQGILR